MTTCSAVLNCFIHTRLFAPLWPVAWQASLSMGILQARMLEWVAMPSPGDLPDPVMEHASLASPALAGGFFTTTTTWKAWKQSVQFSWSCLTVCDPMDSSTPGFSVRHQLTELGQTHVHWISDAIQPSHPLSSPPLPAFNLSQHQDLFQWVSSSHQVAKDRYMLGENILPGWAWVKMGSGSPLIAELTHKCYDVQEACKARNTQIWSEEILINFVI